MSRNRIFKVQTEKDTKILLMSTNIQQSHQKKYKDYNQNRLVELPILLSELSKDNVLVQIINEIIENIELNLLDKYYSQGGCPPYHPRMMIKVWIYGFCLGVYTSRKLAKKLREDVGFMWLSGMQQPCFKTLSEFRGKRLQGLIDDVFKQVLTYLVVNGYVDLNDLYADGSKWEANANKHKITWAKNTVRYKDAVLKRVDEILDKIAELQKEEDAIYGNRDLKEKEVAGQIHLILTSEELREQLKKLNEIVSEQADKKKQEQFHRLGKQLQKEEEKLQKYEDQEKVLAGRNSYSQTDEDATALRMKDDQLKPGYNVQITSSEQFIVNVTMHQNASDSVTLIPHVEQLKKRTEGLVPPVWQVSLTADAAYGSEENYAYLEKENVKAYIKYQLWYQEITGELSKKKYNRENWVYNASEDYYMCPNQKKMVHKETKQIKSTNDYTKTVEVYECESCKDCPFFKECRGENAKPESNRTIQVSKKLEEYKNQARALLSSEKGLEKRSQRSVDVETPFGDIKYNMGHRRFILREMGKVNVEFILLAIAHNVRKVYCNKTGIWKEYYAQRAAKRAQKQKIRA
jgi:transposase